MTFIEIREKQSYLIDWDWRVARTAFLSKQFEQNFTEDFFALSSDTEPKGHSTLHGCPWSLALKQQNNISISHNHNKLEIQSIYLALESNFSQVRNGMPWPLDGKRRKLRWLQCPQMSVSGQKWTEEPAESALPKCFQSTTNKHRNSITWWKTNRDKLKSY
jgi:hypothetical protein